MIIDKIDIFDIGKRRGEYTEKKLVSDKVDHFRLKKRVIALVQVIDVDWTDVVGSWTIE